jgi:hypothetical protein
MGVARGRSTTRYAAHTKVPVRRSRDEIERTVERYGADAFGHLRADGKAKVQFRKDGRTVRFEVPIDPDPKQERQKWRALALVIKAKLEATASGILTFEESFFAHIVMPDGRTVYEAAREPLALAYERGGGDVPLLPGSPN